MSSSQQKEMNVTPDNNTGEDNVVTTKMMNKDMDESKDSDSVFNSFDNDSSVELLSKDLDKDEPILIESRNRFVLFPIANKEVC